MFTKAKRFEQLLEKVTDFAIIFKNTEGIIEEWNIGAERLFGYTAEEAIGQSILIIYTPEDRVNQISPLEMKIAAETGVCEDERWHLRKDGSVFFASGLLHSIYEKDSLTCYVKIVRDLTERVELEAALEESRQMLEIKAGERISEQGEAIRSLRLEMAANRRKDVLRQRLMQKVIDMQEDERKRISRDIHDHLGQEMTALKLQLHAFREQLGNDAKLTERFDKVLKTAENLDSTIDFIAWELRPAALEEIGLEAALNNYVKQWSKQFQANAEVAAPTLSDRRLAHSIEVNLYRIVQEALNNIAKHANANNVSILLEKPEDKIVLIIEDDGVGFNLEEKVNEAQGLGLIGMGERAALVNGEIEIESAIGNGTTIYVRVPASYEGAEA
jgi:PAS domain S-box-containing protein